MNSQIAPVPGQRTVIWKPFDAHVHLRRRDLMMAVLRYSVRSCCGIVVMPNIGGGGNPHVYGCNEAIEYRDEIQRELNRIGSPEFYFGLTLYLTDNTHPDEIISAFEQGLIVGVKMYPAHATTNSAEGVTDPRKCADCFRAMAEAGIPLLVHGEEVNMKSRDCLDWEGDFMRNVFPWLVHEFPTLKISLEHISTSLAVDALRYGLQDPGRIMQATLTPQHFTMSINDLLGGLLNPHLFCKPVLKRLSDLRAVRAGLLDMNGSSFLPIALGTDSAPHIARNKHCECGCAGCFSARHAIGIYANGFPDFHLPDQKELFWHFSVGRAMNFYPTAAREIARRGLGLQTIELEWVEKVPMPPCVQVGLSADLIHHMPHPFVGKPGWVETYLL